MIFVLNSLVNPDKGLTPHTPRRRLSRLLFLCHDTAQLAPALEKRSALDQGNEARGVAFFHAPRSLVTALESFSYEPGLS